MEVGLKMTCLWCKRGGGGCEDGKGRIATWVDGGRVLV